MQLHLRTAPHHLRYISLQISEVHIRSVFQQKFHHLVHVTPCSRVQARVSWVRHCVHIRTTWQQVFGDRISPDLHRVMECSPTTAGILLHVTKEKSIRKCDNTTNISMLGDNASVLIDDHTHTHTHTHKHTHTHTHKHGSVTTIHTTVTTT